MNMNICDRKEKQRPEFEIQHTARNAGRRPVSFADHMSLC